MQFEIKIKQKFQVNSPEDFKDLKLRLIKHVTKKFIHAAMLQHKGDVLDLCVNLSYDRRYFYKMSNDAGVDLHKTRREVLTELGEP